MAIANRRRLPIPTAAEQADRVLSPERKRELTIDTMASWALEGMQPTRQTVENINAYLRGEVTMDEYLRKLKGA
ncbi:antitoxin VbhA family protein [Paenarthrobacter sp. PH39-S1]|uniref:antitoxin VbhA family protein n=1 Tax=Paenarthrobacter sp. PH39-S1 TaxID=3046204 RepID=UPI0024B9BB4E|nr:antitoxin VbhA family protein [Paenarthrobacter sp. PH39-S1]MDJ0356060.1 antitoxin VbhA family protein [Paenarthrobacter sp. PH39-S1]